MFEKEAEEKYCKGCKSRIEQCLWAWRNTNGLNEPNEKNCSCIKVPAYIAGAEFGYNKANEWHYVKDGDLPKEFDKPYLCYLNGYFEVGYFMAYKEQPWHFDNYYLDNEDVDAWKEIVPPKEIKEK